MGRGHRWRAALSVGAVAALSVALFTASARLAEPGRYRHAQDLPGLVQSETERAAGLASAADGLRAEVDALTERVNAADGRASDGTPEAVLVAAGSVPVAGRGLEVTLDDAPPDVLGSSTTSYDDLVVHQQDLQAVVNALWAGGAEALTLMGQRVVATTAFQCVGNVLRLHGAVYSPPYTVAAIGDPATLRAALARSPSVETYLDYVDAYGLGWSVHDRDRVEMDAYTGATDLTWAAVPPGVDPVTDAAPVATARPDDEDDA